MNKTSFGFWWASSTSSQSEVIKFQLQPQIPDSDVQELVQHVSPTAPPQNCQVDINTESAKTPNELQFEQILSHLLRYGVIFASTIVLIGGILYLIRHGAESASYQIFEGEPSRFRSPKGVAIAVLSGSYRGIIQLGLLILVAIPVIRVVISLFLFLRQREYTYVVITLIVLTVLMYSLVGAYF